ncbi:hypothetical protein ACQEU6_28695 [Spirillospora sp. CA-108201]
MTVVAEPGRCARDLRRWRTRRRISQLEPAVRADTTQRHLSFLEQGRSRPGRAMVVRHGHMPYPAVVVRPHGELVAANPALGVLTEGAAPALLEPPVNVLRLALHPDGMAPRVENLAEWGRHLTAGLREEARRAPDPRLITTLTSFATAVDVTLSELRLEAFLPADETTADLLRRRGDVPGERPAPRTGRMAG